MELCTYCGTPRTGLSCCGEVHFDEREDDVDSDKELLELAAKAAGIEIEWGDTNSPGYYSQWRGLPQWNNWNPLTDDGDALRLAVKLGIAVIPYPIYVQPKHSVIAKQYKDSAAIYRQEDVSIEEIEVYGDDPCAATRRAIVRAAAAIGKDMP